MPDLDYPDADVRRSLLLLRESALNLGLEEAAITYGWSILRLGNAMIDAALQAKATP